MPQSADKKPEKYVGPDGKTKIRMVPVDKEVIKTEAKDPEEYDNEGSMMKGQLRQICSANEKLMSMVKDDENLPEWVQSKVTKATDYIRSVRDYLESEKMEEKTLTPAEVRKRDKIAKAIKKDDPNMPMDKKMAIATATAKRVAEESEQLDELTAAELKLINQMYDKKGNLTPMGKKVMAHGKAKVNEVSSNTLSNYIRKSAADVSKSRGDARRQDKRIGGQKMADDKIRKKMGYSSQAKVPAGTNEADDATVRMYKDNPDMMKSKGPGGLKSLSKKAQKDVKKSMNEAATPAMKKAADELNSYAKKHGGIDKADFMKASKMLSSGKAGMALIKFVDGQDTDVYEKIIRVMAKHMGKQTVEKMFKVNIREESVNELSKDTMQSYWDKTKGDDAFSGSRKANNRLKGAINVTTKLDKLKKMVKK